MGKAVISNRYDFEGKAFKKNSLYFKSLPEDEVEYDPKDMSIKKILNRPGNITISKVTNKELTLPLLSSTFRIHTEYPDGNYLIDIPSMNLTLINGLYDAISNIYLKTGISGMYPLERSSQTHFTKGFQILNHLDTFNVDPKESTDFDDAISFECSGDNVTAIYIHIVDFDYYVSPGSLEDVRAYGLGMTLYNPEGVIRATGRVDEYSLKKGVPRRVITVEFSIINNKISAYEIYRSEITIKKRYDYESYVPHPALLKFVRDNMREEVLSIPSVKMVVEKGRVKDHSIEWSSDINHRIVETLMIMTNVAVTNHLESRNLKYPSRYHPKSRFSAEVCEHIHPVVKSYIELKNYSRACYSVDLSGHTGLNLDRYTHFTSPLRRYPDVMVHRILAGYSYPEMDHMMEYFNKREKLITELSFYYSNEMKKTIISVNRTRYIVKISQSGICVLDPDIMLEEYIHVSNIKPHSKYRLEADSLKGEDVEYGLGDFYQPG